MAHTKDLCDRMSLVHRVGHEEPPSYHVNRTEDLVDHADNVDLVDHGYLDLVGLVDLGNHGYLDLVGLVDLWNHGYLDHVHLGDRVDVVSPRSVRIDHDKNGVEDKDHESKAEVEVAGEVVEIWMVALVAVHEVDIVEYTPLLCVLFLCIGGKQFVGILYLNVPLRYK